VGVGQKKDVERVPHKASAVNKIGNVRKEEQARMENRAPRALKLRETE